MTVEHGIPKLHNVKNYEVDLKAALRNLYPDIDQVSITDICRQVAAARQQKHGTMVVVSLAAEYEVGPERLGPQCTPIKKARLTDGQIHSATSMDGAVLLDGSGYCHAIGVILDGLATTQGTPSRGSRYNSAVRYVESCNRDNARVRRCVAVVISTDGMLSIIPAPASPP
jgi:DNA integrity scanning protein DisA with diadenylate cyclase activity